MVPHIARNFARLRAITHSSEVPLGFSDFLPTRAGVPGIFFKAHFFPIAMSLVRSNVRYSPKAAATATDRGGS